MQCLKLWKERLSSLFTHYYKYDTVHTCKTYYFHWIIGIWHYKHTAFSWGCYCRIPQEEKISPETKLRVIFFLSVVVYRNTLNQRQYVLYYTECPSEDGIAEGSIAGCDISLQYHPLFWWEGLRKVKEKYHIYIYQWNCRINTNISC